MILIECPFCGVRDHAEFRYGGDGSIHYPALDADLEHWHDALYLRENIDGMQLETWHHVFGCRQWLLVERDTVSHEISSVKPANNDIGVILDSALTDAGGGTFSSPVGSGDASGSSHVPDNKKE